MKKALIWIAVLLVVILGTGTYLAYNHLDYLVKLAVEYYGTDILKTDVQVDTVRIKAADGRASIKGFTIDNPDGFKSASAFGVSKVSVDLDMKNSTTDKIIIDKILIRAPGITYEVNQDLKSNLSSLLDNVNSSAAVGQKNDTSAGSGFQPVFVIRHFSLEQARLHALITPANNREYDFTLRNIELRNLGGEDGMSPAKISEKILDTLYKEVQSELKNRGIAAKYRQQIDAGKQQVKSKAEQKLDEKKESAKDKLRNLL